MSDLVDQFGRKINYLRVSITDRCNLRCQYCMPEEGVDSLPPEEILGYEEIEQIVKAGAELGISRIRLTGGEPLVRPESERLVSKLKQLSGIEEVTMTTNGVLLSELGSELAIAGLDRVNISLDTLQPSKFKQVSRCDKFSQVWQGIKTGLQEGMTPVKLNVVVIKGFNATEILDFVDLTTELPLHIRFIEFMPGQAQALSQKKGYLAVDKIKEKIREDRTLQSAQLEGNGPAQYYKVPAGLGTIGFISPVSNHFCSSCNRLRLTATGELKACLYSSHGINLKKSLRNGESIEQIQEKFEEVANMKLKDHTVTRNDKIDTNMSQIGG